MNEKELKWKGQLYVVKQNKKNTHVSFAHTKSPIKNATAWCVLCTNYISLDTIQCQYYNILWINMNKKYECYQIIFIWCFRVITCNLH